MKKKKLLTLSVLCLLFSVFLIACQKKENENENNPNYDSSRYLSGYHYAQMDVEDYGTIILALDADSAPATVTNFVNLVKEGFYNGLTFHRIVDGFMIQGGDPDGNGTGSATYKIPGEFSLNDYNNPISHVRGTISMARSEDYDSASSQFFIVHEDSTALDGSYAAFGTVVSGMEVVDAICTNVIPEDDTGNVLAENQPVITSVTILPEDYFTENEPEKELPKPLGEVSFIKMDNADNLDLETSLVVDEDGDTFLISYTVNLSSISLYKVDLANGLNLEESTLLTSHDAIESNTFISLKVNVPKDELSLLLVAEEESGALAQFLLCHDSSNDSAYLVPIVN